MRRREAVGVKVRERGDRSSHGLARRRTLFVVAPAESRLPRECAPARGCSGAAPWSACCGACAAAIIDPAVPSVLRRSVISARANHPRMPLRHPRSRLPPLLPSRLHRPAACHAPARALRLHVRPCCWCVVEGGTGVPGASLSRAAWKRGGWGWRTRAAVSPTHASNAVRSPVPTPTPHLIGFTARHPGAWVCGAAAVHGPADACAVAGACACAPTPSTHLRRLPPRRTSRRPP